MGENNRVRDQDIVWDDSGILSSFNCSATQISMSFNRHKFRGPTKTSLYVIVSRGRIPDRWRPAFLYLAIKDRGFSPSSMIKKGVTA